MKNEAYFFTNIKDIEFLRERTRISHVQKKPKQRYEIFDRLILENGEFQKLGCNFIETKEYLNKYIVELNISKSGKYTCLLISSPEYDYSILVNTQGYSYARTVAILEKGEI